MHIVGAGRDGVIVKLQVFDVVGNDQRFKDLNDFVVVNADVFHDGKIVLFVIERWIDFEQATTPTAEFTLVEGIVEDLHVVDRAGLVPGGCIDADLHGRTGRVEVVVVDADRPECFNEQPARAVILDAVMTDVYADVIFVQHGNDAGPIEFGQVGFKGDVAVDSSVEPIDLFNDGLFPGLEVFLTAERDGIAGAEGINAELLEMHQLQQYTIGISTMPLS